MNRYAIIVTLVLSLAGMATAQTKVKYNTYLRSDAGSDTMWDGRVIRIYGITTKLSEAPHIPAKTLYCMEGDTLVLRTLSISQGDHHTIHLHGLDADTPNDGDPATSFMLSHMQDTDYTVYASHAGTYLYHCHVADVVHVQMGMYGLIVVKPRDGSNTAWTGGPSFDRSYNWLLSEVDPVWHDSIPKHDPITDTVQIPSYQPKYFLVNGRSETQIPKDDSTTIRAVPGQTVYLRIGAIGFFYQRIIFPSWMQARKIDSDGRPLSDAIENDTLEIAPGERYGVLLNASGEHTDSIAVEFINMNTDSVWSVQHVPVVIKPASVTSDPKETTRLSVYPNPAATQVTFSLDGEESGRSHIKIMNVLGEIVYQTEDVLPIQVNLGSIPSGTYTSEITTTHGRYFVSFINMKR
jgi:FtsP/CotA-like multicopper oxidase with cupredoxin domain